MMVYVKFITLKTKNIYIIIINKLKLKSVPITLTRELTRRNRVGLVAMVIASLGSIYQFAAPLSNITPDLADHVLVVQ